MRSIDCKIRKFPLHSFMQKRVYFKSINLMFYADL